MKKSVKVIFFVVLLVVVVGVICVIKNYQFGLEKQAALSEQQSLSLQEAISLNNLEAVKFLVKNGANIETPINQGGDGKYFTSLGWALFTNRPEIAIYLINQNADITASTPIESSMLYWSLAHEMSEVALLLIDKGAIITAADGYNPAQHADILGMTQVVEKLKEKGITPDGPGSEDLD